MIRMRLLGCAIAALGSVYVLLCIAAFHGLVVVAGMADGDGLGEGDL